MTDVDTILAEAAARRLARARNTTACPRCGAETGHDADCRIGWVLRHAIRPMDETAYLEGVPYPYERGDE